MANSGPGQGRPSFDRFKPQMAGELLSVRIVRDCDPNRWRRTSLCVGKQRAATFTLVPTPPPGRKRPQSDFNTPGGDRDRDRDEGFFKKGRFEEGGGGGGGGTNVPPATLRVLVRNQDAGGIIGKVGVGGGWGVCE